VAALVAAAPAAAAAAAASCAGGGGGAGKLSAVVIHSRFDKHRSAPGGGTAGGGAILVARAITIPGAKALRVTFDGRSCLPRSSTLKFAEPWWGWYKLNAVDPCKPESAWFQPLKLKLTYPGSKIICFQFNLLKNKGSIHSGSTQICLKKNNLYRYTLDVETPLRLHDAGDWPQRHRASHGHRVDSQALGGRDRHGGGLYTLIIQLSSCPMARKRLVSTPEPT
jgi:hypothetical protein